MPRFPRFHLARWFTRRQEVPFLFTLAFLFFMSGGFLVMQVWGNPDPQGAATAGLQTPVALPVINASEAPSEPVAPVVAAVAPAPEPVDATSELQNKEPPPLVVPPAQPSVLPASLPASPTASPDVKPVAAPKKIVKAAAPVVKEPVVEKKPKTDKVEKKEKVEKAKKIEKPAKDIPAMVVAPPLGQEEIKAPVLKKKARKPSRQKDPDLSLDPPQGWVWFSAPLEWKIVDGKWKIEVGVASPAVAAPPASSQAVDSPEDEAWANAVAVEEEPEVKTSELVEVETEQPEPVIESRVATEAAPAIDVPKSASPEKPKSAVQTESRVLFQAALTKIERTKEKRVSEAGRYRVELPSRGGSSRTVPASLVRLMDAVDQLASKARSSDLDSESMSAPMNGDVNADGTHASTASSAESGQKN